MKFHIVSDADKARAARAVSSLPSGNWTLSIDETRRIRSVQQNARYWAILTQIAQQMALRMGKDYDSTTWHEWFKARFLGRELLDCDGLAHHVAKRSSTLKTNEFADYCAQVEHWAIENGVMLE